MRETRVVDFDAGGSKAQPQLFLQAVRDFLDVGAQRDARVGLVAFFYVVVCVDARHVAQRGLGLHRDVGDVVVHVEERLGGIGHVPHHDGRNLDGVALLVVDLDALAVVGARTERNLGRDAGGRLGCPQPLLAGLFGSLLVGAGRAHLAAVEGVGPVETGFADGADVVSEEEADLGLTRLEGDEPRAHDDAQREQDESSNHQGNRKVRCLDARIVCRGEEHDGVHEASAARGVDDDVGCEHCPARLCLDDFLGCHQVSFPRRPRGRFEAEWSQSDITIISRSLSDFNPGGVEACKLSMASVWVRVLEGRRV